MNRILVILILSLTAQGALAGELSEMLHKSISSRMDVENSIVNEFSKDMKEWCQEEHSDGCLFPYLYDMYRAKIDSLSDRDKAGLSLAATDFSNVELPLLQSGAWSQVLFSEKSGLDTSIQIITLRIALEKALLAHAQFIRSKEYSRLNSFAALTVPRMIASFSAYSQTLRRLIILQQIKCTKPKSLGCQELDHETDVLKTDILRGVDVKSFLSGLQNMNENNSSDSLLKAKKVNHVVNLLSRLKTQVSLKELVLSLKGKEHPLVQELKRNLADISSGLTGDVDIEAANMLAAIVILSEIQEVQNQTTTSAPGSLNSKLTEQTSQEFSVLQSAVLSVLKAQQVIE